MSICQSFENNSLESASCAQFYTEDTEWVVEFNYIICREIKT